MTRTIYIREIIAVIKEPKLCPTCKKEDRLEKKLFLREEQMEKLFYVLDVKH